MHLDLNQAIGLFQQTLDQKTKELNALNMGDQIINTMGKRIQELEGALKEAGIELPVPTPAPARA